MHFFSSVPMVLIACNRQSEKTIRQLNLEGETKVIVILIKIERTSPFFGFPAAFPVSTIPLVFQFIPGWICARDVFVTISIMEGLNYGV
jgi:hypothetical protein